jgi:hypothetical protein
VKFLWFSRYLLLGFIAAWVLLIFFGPASELTLALGLCAAVGIGFSALLCVIAQLAVMLGRKRGAR